MDDLAQRVQALGWRVRPVREDDTDGLVALIGGVYAEYPGCVLDPDGVDADLYRWRGHLDRLGGTGWVVHADGVLVACVGVAPAPVLPSLGTGREGVELKRLYVHADARRQGLGGALVGRVEGWARAEGAGVVMLWSDSRFDDAHRLYTSLGYHDTGRRRALNDPSETIEVEFVRHL